MTINHTTTGEPLSYHWEGPFSDRIDTPRVEEDQTFQSERGNRSPMTEVFVPGTSREVQTHFVPSRYTLYLDGTNGKSLFIMCLLLFIIHR